MRRGIFDIHGLDDLLEKAASLLGACDNARVTPLCGDGSDRKFFRIFCGSGSLIGLISPRRVKAPLTDENDSYLLIGNHLRSRGLPAPRILYADTGEGRFLLEDAGDLHCRDLSCPAGLSSNRFTLM